MPLGDRTEKGQNVDDGLAVSLAWISGRKLGDAVNVPSAGGKLLQSDYQCQAELIKGNVTVIVKFMQR